MNERGAEKKGGELSGFLMKLKEDSQLRNAFMQDAAGTVKEAGLSEKSAKALLSRDPDTIKAAVKEEIGPEGDPELFMIVIAPGE